MTQLAADSRSASHFAFCRLSINVILRQRKGVADESDLGGVLAGGEDFDDVEAETDVGEVEQTQPCYGTFGHAALFVIVDGVRRAAALFGGTGFHLDEDEGVFGLVAADKVDFAAAGRDEVAVEDAVAVAAEVAFGLALAPLSENDMARQRFLRARVAFAPPVEKSGDGRGRGHDCGGLRGVRAHHSLCGGRSHTADSARRFRA